MKPLSRLLGAALVLTLVLGGAVAAEAHENRPDIIFTSPIDTTAEKPLSDNKPLSAAIRMERDHAIKSVRATVVRCAGEECRDPVLDESVQGNDGASQTVSFPLPLRYNGRYRATITATGVHVGLLGNESDAASSSKTLDFYVAIPPAAPTDVRLAVAPEARTVTVTWAPNNPDLEPDLLGYLVERRRAGEPNFVLRGEPTKGTSFTDSFTPTDPGGDYEYRVIAVRQGATPDKGVTSNPSAPVPSVKVPDPPGGVAPAAGGTTVNAGTSTTSAVTARRPGALATSGSIDLSGYSTLRNRARPAPAPRSVQAPDTGFQSTLPFATTRPVDGEVGEDQGGAELGETEGENAQERELGVEETINQRQRSTAFLAAGLLATVLAMHLLWVRSEVKRAPLEPMVPEDAGPAGARKPVSVGR